MPERQPGRTMIFDPMNQTATLRSSAHYCAHTAYRKCTTTPNQLDDELLAHTGQISRKRRLGTSVSTSRRMRTQTGGMAMPGLRMRTQRVESRNAALPAPEKCDLRYLETLKFQSLTGHGGADGRRPSSFWPQERARMALRRVQRPQIQRTMRPKMATSRSLPRECNPRDFRESGSEDFKICFLRVQT